MEMFLIKTALLPASMARLDVPLTGDQEVGGFNPGRVNNFLSWRFMYVTHYENTPIQIYWNFYHQKKMKIFR